MSIWRLTENRNSKIEECPNERIYLVTLLEKRTLIIGSGPCAVSIAKNLPSKDIEVLIAARENKIAGLEDLDKEKTEILLNTGLLACKGFVGNYDVSMDVGGEKLTRSVSNVVIAEEGLRTPKFSDYGLKASSGVISLSEIMKDTNPDKNSANVEKLVFFAGLNSEGNPVVTEDIMRTCLKLQTEFKKRTFILTGNLKVAGNGLEKLYRETRAAGTVYVKFTDEMPEIHQGSDGKVVISFLDEITQERFRLSPDIVVVDETISPSTYLEKLADIFRINTDQAGFVQADNVHRLSVCTNRKGILASGLSRAVQSRAEQITDAANAVTAIIGLFDAPPDEASLKAKIIYTGKCVGCLTCFRICPFVAITLDPRPSVVPEACEGCGICTAECPKGSITMQGLSLADIVSNINEGKPARDEKGSPLIIAFCCSRSAAGSYRLASDMSFPLPDGLRVIELPCAGSVSIEHIFAAFKNNADGVMVLTCHEGNCFSEHGNIYAKNRVNVMAGRLAEIGFETKRLMLGTLASNMGREFADMVNSFEKMVRELGIRGKK